MYDTAGVELKLCLYGISLGVSLSATIRKKKKKTHAAYFGLGHSKKFHFLVKTQAKNYSFLLNTPG